MNQKRWKPTLVPYVEPKRFPTKGLILLILAIAALALAVLRVYR